MGLRDIDLKGKVKDEFERILIKGSNGEQGKSAYELTVKNGYQGTETEFAEHMRNLKDTYNHINGENYNFEPDQPVLIHNDELLYKGRSITDIFSEMNTRLNTLKENATAYMTTGRNFNESINDSMTNFIVTDTAPDSNITTVDVSVDMDGSIVTWYDTTNTTQYLYTSKKFIKLNPNCDKMFYDCRKLTALDLSMFDASEVRTIERIFDDCRRVTTIDMHTWNMSNTTSMREAFNSCRKLTDIKFFYNTSNVSDMTEMFNDCESFVDITIPFDTSNVISMRYMFANCDLLKSVDLSECDTSNVTNMVGMFQYCYELTNLKIPNVSSVVNMSGMFDGCSLLNNIDIISGWEVPNLVDMSYMFSGCTSLSFANLNWNVPKLENFEGVFENCTSLTSIDLSAMNTPVVNNISALFSGCTSLISAKFPDLTNGSLMWGGSIFENCASLTSPDLSTLNTVNIDGIYKMFENCTSLVSLDLSSFDISNINDSYFMFNGCTALTSINYGDKFNIPDAMRPLCMGTTYTTNETYQMFYNCPANRPDWTLGIWNAEGTFVSKGALLATGNIICNAISYNATRFTKSVSAPSASVTTTDISDSKNGSVITWYDATNKTQYWYSSETPVYMNSNSSYFFSSRYNMVQIDLREFNTSIVNNMNSMFQLCSSLTSLDLSSFDTSNVINMGNMFNNCSSLTSLDISSFNTSNVRTMSDMFNGCTKLRTINISHFDTSNVTTMYGMFKTCNGLTSLDLSNFDISKVTNTSDMFYGCDGITSITFGPKFIIDPTTIKLTYADANNKTFGMFGRCKRYLQKPIVLGESSGEWNFAGTYVLDSQGVGPGLPLSTTITDWKSNAWKDVYLSDYGFTVNGQYADTDEVVANQTFFNHIYRNWTYDTASGGNGNHICLKSVKNSADMEKFNLYISDLNSTNYTYRFPTGYHTQFKECSHPIIERKNRKTNAIQYIIVGDYSNKVYNSIFNMTQMNPSGMFANPSTIEWYGYINTNGLYIYEPGSGLKKRDLIIANWKTRTEDVAPSTWFADTEIYKFYCDYSSTFICVYHKNATNGKPYECFSTMNGYLWEKIIDLPSPPGLVSSAGLSSLNLWIFVYNNRLYDSNGYIYDSIDVTDAVSIVKGDTNSRFGISYKNGLMKVWQAPQQYYNYKFYSGSDYGGYIYDLGRTVFGLAGGNNSMYYYSLDLKDGDTDHKPETYTNMGLYSVMTGVAP